MKSSVAGLDKLDKEVSSQQLGRALDILELLAYADRPRALGEIATAVRAPKGSVHRLLTTLLERGYAVQDARSGEYRAGLRCFELGSVWVQAFDLRTVALPHLRHLNEATQETVHLAVYDRGDTVYIEKLESTHAVVAKSYVGRRCPAFCVAPGRALLAHQPAAEIKRVLSARLPRFTDATIVNVPALNELLAKVRREGFAVNHGCFREGVGGVAVPIRDHTGAAVAAVGICLPEQRFGAGRQRELREATFATAQVISTHLGFSGQLVGVSMDIAVSLPSRAPGRRSRTTVN